MSPQFESASSFSEGLALVTLKDTCGFIDKSGSIVLRLKRTPPRPTVGSLAALNFDCDVASGDFAEGVARWRVGDKYTYINRTGKTVIPARYDLTFHFSDGLAADQVGGKWVLHRPFRGDGDRADGAPPRGGFSSRTCLRPDRRRALRLHRHDTGRFRLEADVSVPPKGRLPAPPSVSTFHRTAPSARPLWRCALLTFKVHSSTRDGAVS